MYLFCLFFKLFYLFPIWLCISKSRRKTPSARLSTSAKRVLNFPLPKFLNVKTNDIDREIRAQKKITRFQQFKSSRYLQKLILTVETGAQERFERHILHTTFKLSRKFWKVDSWLRGKGKFSLGNMARHFLREGKYIRRTICLAEIIVKWSFIWN